MKAIAKREFKAYFLSPIGYVCIGILMALYGFYFYQVLLSNSTYYIANVFSTMFIWSMMIIPIITMKSMSDDKRFKTDQALLTAPVGLMPLVLGKFLAAFAVYAIAICASSLIPCLVITFIGAPSWGIIIGNLLGSLFYGAAMIAIGIFISSLTQSQVIAAIGTFGVAMFLLVCDQIATMLKSGFISSVVSWVSFNNRYTPFTKGMFDIASLVYFLSVAGVFVFLTARKLESKRWS